MKLFSALALTLALSLSVTMGDAEAKRLGGAKSTGMQRSVAPPSKSPQAAPASTPAAAAAPGAAGATAAAAPKRSWMGPLAGLAAGLGLAALASHLGLGGAMANMLMFGLLAMVVIGIIGFVMRKRAAAAAAGSASGNGNGNGFQYAGAAAGNTAMPDVPTSRVHEVSMPRTAADNSTASAASTHNGSGSMIGSAIGAGVGGAVGGAVGSEASSPMTTAAPAAIPADFDTAGFERSAKVQFIRLQAANDAADLSDIREFTTPEMFAELSMDITERGSATQHTEVISVTAQVLEVVEEAQRYVASVRFAGQVRESTGAAAEAFDEIWHLTKPRAGQGGWLLSGIQQHQA